MEIFNDFKGRKLRNFFKKYGYRLDEICSIYIILIKLFHYFKLVTEMKTVFNRVFQRKNPVIKMVKMAGG